jgi:hypothetical protein
MHLQKQKRIKRLEEENEAESRLIKKLEKQLHLNKRKNKTTVPASFAHDGLDCMLVQIMWSSVELIVFQFN